MIKLSLIITLIFISSSFAQIKFGRINDPDGYVNIRKESNSKSKIIDTIKDKELFEYLENDTDWWNITKLNGSKGFVHKSRIKEEYKGIIFRNKIYNEKEYRIITKNINRDKLHILLIKISPKPGFEEKEMLKTRSEVFNTGIVQCSAQIRSYYDNTEIDRLEYLNIESLGGCADVSFPEKQISEKYIFGSKYGDYDGRLIQIDESANIVTYPGGNYFITNDSKYLVTIWDSDMPGLTVVDLDKGKELFQKEFDDQEYFADWYEHDGKYYTFQADDSFSNSRGSFELSIEDKKFRKIKIDYKKIKKYKKLELSSAYLENHCDCAK